MIDVIGLDIQTLLPDRRSPAASPRSHNDSKKGQGAVNNIGSTQSDSSAATKDRSSSKTAAQPSKVRMLHVVWCSFVVLVPCSGDGGGGGTLALQYCVFNLATQRAVR